MNIVTKYIAFSSQVDNLPCIVFSKFATFARYPSSVLESYEFSPSLSRAMSHKSKLARIASGEYLADCDSENEDVDESTKLPGILGTSVSSWSIPIFDPEMTDISSPSQSEGSPLLMSRLDLAADQAPLVIPCDQTSKDSNSTLEPSESPINTPKATRKAPIRQPTPVESFENYNKPLPTLPSRQSSTWSLSYLPR